MKIRTSLEVIRQINNIRELSEKDKYYAMVFITSLISISNREYKKDEYWHGYISRASKYFRNLRGGTDEATFLEILEQNKLIKINHCYSMDNFSKSFKVLINHGGSYTTVKAEDYLNEKQLTNHIKRIRRREEKDLELEQHKQNIIDIIDFNLNAIKELYKRRGIQLLSNDKKDLEKELESLNIDNYNRKMQVLIYQTLELIDIEQCRITKGKNSNRHYHALSNMCKDLRDCLESKLKGKKHLVEVDIKNSQPLLLLALIKAKNIEIEEQILKLTQEGYYYEMLASILGMDYKMVANDREYRSEFKNVVFRDILFSKNRNNANFKALKKSAPLYAQAIIDLDKDNLLNRDLQQLEAQIMLPLTVKNRGVGIHDSVILACAEDLAEIYILKEQIVKEFKKFDLDVILHEKKIA